jgi:hypothetical protein
MRSRVAEANFCDAAIPYILQRRPYHLLLRSPLSYSVDVLPAMNTIAILEISYVPYSCGVSSYTYHGIIWHYTLGAWLLPSTRRTSD